MNRTMVYKNQRFIQLLFILLCGTSIGLASCSTLDSTASLANDITIDIPTDFTDGVKDSVTTTVTKSGLKYLLLKTGHGPKPKAQEWVQVHYTGRSVGGTEFATSRNSEPLIFQMGQNQVIAGWEEGVSMLHEGSKAMLIIPPELAYGESGAGDIIPPNATLIFSVELLRILDNPAAAPTSTAVADQVSSPAPTVIPTLAAPTPTVATPTVATPTEVDAADYVKTASGLNYYDFKVGTGASPKPGSVLSVHYTGWLAIDGTKFDSSFDRGTPLTFVLGKGQVIDGWEQGVNTMRVGGKRQLLIPSELAYDNAGYGTMIAPDATLLFEVELVSILEGAPSRPTVVDPSDYIVTDTGLKYYDIEVGVGDSPGTGDIVDVHYTGWLLDGTKFDSSFDRWNLFSFALEQGQVITGWEEGIRTMRLGGKRQLLIPPELAYGEGGYQDLIPPGAPLLFEIELAYIQK